GQTTLCPGFQCPPTVDAAVVATSQVLDLRLVLRKVCQEYLSGRQRPERDLHAPLSKGKHGVLGCTARRPGRPASLSDQLKDFTCQFETALLGCEPPVHCWRVDVARCTVQVERH